MRASAQSDDRYFEATIEDTLPIMVFGSVDQTPESSLRVAEINTRDTRCNVTSCSSKNGITRSLSRSGGTGESSIIELAKAGLV